MEGSGQNLAETTNLGRRGLFVVNGVFLFCSDGCKFMDNAFCVEKRGWRRDAAWKDCLHGTRRDATRYRDGFALSGRGLEVS